MENIKTSNLVDEVDFSLESDDDKINYICNEFYFYQTLKTKNTYVSKKRNFLKLKENKPVEWNNFVKLEKLCSDNDINYREYIPYALDEIIKIHSFVHVKYLLNPVYVSLFKEATAIEAQYKKINHYVVVSFKKIIALCNDKKLKTFSEFLKFVIREKRLGHYIKSGVISKYILVLIPNIKEIKSYFDDESIHELDNFVINKYDKLLNEVKISLTNAGNEDYLNLIKKINIELIKNNKQ